LEDGVTPSAGEQVHAYWLGKWTVGEVVDERVPGHITVRVPTPIPGAPPQDTPLPRHWVRAMAGSTSKPAAASAPSASRPPPAGASAIRTWTDSSGKFKIEAKFIALAEGKVTLEKPDGVQIKMPLEKLSAADQKFVTEEALRP
jgi:hypothetical protein